MAEAAALKLEMEVEELGLPRRMMETKEIDPDPKEDLGDVDDLVLPRRNLDTTVCDVEEAQVLDAGLWEQESELVSRLSLARLQAILFRREQEALERGVRER